MKLMTALVATTLATTAYAAPRAQASPRAATSDPLVPAVVVLQDQAHLPARPHTTRLARLRAAEQALRATAANTQPAVLHALASALSAGQVADVQPLWIQNAISLRATPQVLATLANRPDVASVEPDRVLVAPEPDPALDSATAAVEANLSQVDTPAMWDLGFRGQGVVVASMDTGVDVTHPDLAGSWRGGSNSWYDPNGQHPTTPTDVNGHGTQTMGIMVGGDAGGTSIGMAPAATWIAVKLYNDRGTTTSTAIHLGFQWLLDPDHNPDTADAPQVVNNSWDISAGGCVPDFRQDLQNLRAVGILPVFAAGNYGPQSGTITSPANYPEAFAVAGVDGSDVVDPASSRGPSPCAGATAPALAAPDTSIRTSDLFQGWITDTGTSVGAPHVAGALALLLSALPGLAGSADAQQNALTAGAVDLGPPGVDDDTGYGRLDVLAAYESAVSAPDFSVGVSPMSVRTVAGGTATFSVDVGSLGGFDGDVTLSASGLPAGADATFTPPVITSGVGTAQLDVTTSEAVAAGSYALTVTATSGGTTHSAPATLVVDPPPDFGLAPSPASRSVVAGTGTSYGVSVGALNGFTETVDLSVEGLPASVGTATLSPANVVGSGSSTLSVTTSPSAPPGSYPLTVTGTSGTLTHSAPVTLVVLPRSDFDLTANPTTATIARGKSATYTVSVTGAGGFNGSVAMSVAGAPSRSTISWSKKTVVVAGSTTMTVRTDRSTPRTSYTLVITGTSGALRHQVLVTLAVT
ncbi:MAG: S8 family serine peptidase [Nocardioides sp.]|nr:S8 family serine peptidase [Nocardioides sp.]